MMELNRLLEIAADRETCDFCPDCDNEAACMDCKKVKDVFTSELREYHTAVSAALRRTAEDDKAREEGRLMVLPEPRKPLVWGDDDHDSVLCPDCGEDLMGIPYGERMVLQCPECGQYLDATMEKVLTRQEAEAALGGGEGG